MIMKPKMREFLAYVLATAIEGGSTYWACDMKDVKRENFGDHGKFIVSATWRDAEDEDNKRYPISLESMHTAMGKMAVEAVQRRMNPDHVRTIALNDRTLELWATAFLASENQLDDGDFDYDAGDADCLVQVAIFGDVIYG